MKTFMMVVASGLSLPMISGALAAQPAIDLAPLTTPSVRVHVSTTGEETSDDVIQHQSGTDYQSRRVQEVAHPPLILWNHEPAGTVAEIIVSPEGQIEYVVARYRHELYLLPMTAVRQAPVSGSLQVLLTPLEFQRLPRFFAHRWPAFNSRAFRDKLHAQFVASLDHSDAALISGRGLGMTTPADAGRPSNDTASPLQSGAERPSLNLQTPTEPMSGDAGTAVMVAPEPIAPVTPPADSMDNAASNNAAPQVNVFSGTAPTSGVRSLLFNPAPRFGNAVPNTAAGGVVVPGRVNGQGNALPGGAVGNPGFAPGGGTSTVRSPQAPPTIIGQPGGIVVPNAGTNNATGTGATNRFPAAAPRTGSGAPSAGNTAPANAGTGTPGGAPIGPSASPSSGSGGNAAAGPSPQ